MTSCGLPGELPCTGEISWSWTATGCDVKGGTCDALAIPARVADATPPILAACALYDGAMVTPWACAPVDDLAAVPLPPTLALMAAAVAVLWRVTR